MSTVVVATLIAACSPAGAVVRPFNGPDGERWYEITCREGQADCVGEAERRCPRGFVVDRDDGVTMAIMCKHPSATASASATISAPEPRRIKQNGVTFTLPHDWEDHATASGTVYFAPDERTVAFAQRDERDSPENVARRVMDSIDDASFVTINGRSVLLATGERRITNEPLRSTIAVAVTNAATYWLVCAHRETKAVSKVCKSVLMSMRVDS